MLFIALEIVMIVLFVLILADAVRSFDRNKNKLLLLVLSFAYSLIFENFNIFLSQGHIGSYFYNPGFHMWIWHTPLYIALGWACMIYTAMHISDMLKLKTLVKPFMDALLIVIVYMTLGVVGIVQKLWTYVGYSSSQGWFGVPADNLISWMFVTFIFSFLFRFFTRREDDMINKTTRTEYYFLLPVFAYLAMIVMFSIVNLAEDLLKLTKSEELFMFWAVVIFFALMLRTTTKREGQVLHIDNYTIFVILLTRLLIFSYITWSMMLTRIYQTNLILVIILLATIIAEILIYHSAFGHIGKQIDILPGEKKLDHY